MQEQNANTNSSVHFHGSLHPLSELVDTGVNSILMWQGTSFAPAHDACKHPPAVPIQHWTGQWPPAIVRACIDAAFFKSSTQEVISYRPVVWARKKMNKWAIRNFECNVSKSRRRRAFCKECSLLRIAGFFSRQIDPGLSQHRRGASVPWRVPPAGDDTAFTRFEEDEAVWQTDLIDVASILHWAGQAH